MFSIIKTFISIIRCACAAEKTTCMLYCKQQEPSQELERSNFAILYGTCKTLSGYLVQVCALLFTQKETVPLWAEQNVTKMVRGWSMLLHKERLWGSGFVQPGVEKTKGILVAVSIIQVGEYRED